MKVNIANVLVDNITGPETLDRISEFIASGRPHYIVTTYSEFVVFASQDKDYLEVLNKADLSLPDGVGILWAAKYLSIPASSWLSAVWQLKYTLWSILLYPGFVHQPIHEKVSGSKLIWDIAKLALQNNYSLALVGGEDSVAATSAQILKSKFPGLKINLAISGGKPFDVQTIKEIAESNSDILFVANQPPRQEKWIAENISNLNVRVAIGVGGTFDYIAGKRSAAPKIFITLGLEWLWRLITQPWRIKRMWNALPVFIWTIYKFKLKNLDGKS